MNKRIDKKLTQYPISLKSYNLISYVLYNIFHIRKFYLYYYATCLVSIYQRTLEKPHFFTKRTAKIAGFFLSAK